MLPVALSACLDVEDRLRQLDQTTQVIAFISRNLLQAHPALIAPPTLTNFDFIRLPRERAYLYSVRADHVDHVFVRRVDCFGVGGYL